MSSLSLTKCGAMSMVDKEREEEGGVWEELMELNLQVRMICSGTPLSLAQELVVDHASLIIMVS